MSSTTRRKRTVALTRQSTSPQHATPVPLQLTIDPAPVVDPPAPVKASSYILNSMVRTPASPVVSIHNIDPKKILANYKEGKYKDFPAFLSKVTATNTVSTNISGRNGVSSGPQSPICAHVDTSGVTSMSVTTGNGAFEDQPGGECYYCRHPYTTEAFGYTPQPAICSDDEVVFVAEDKNICSPECLIAYLSYINLRPETRIAYIGYTLDMLRRGYGISHVVPASDFRLLIKNGGTESYDTWVAKRGKYKKMEGVRIVPSKLQFRVLQ